MVSLRLSAAFRSSDILEGEDESGDEGGGLEVDGCGDELRRLLINYDRKEKESNSDCIIGLPLLSSISCL